MQISHFGEDVQSMDQDASCLQKKGTPHEFRKIFTIICMQNGNHSQIYQVNPRKHGPYKTENEETRGAHKNDLSYTDLSESISVLEFIIFESSLNNQHGGLEPEDLTPIKSFLNKNKFNPRQSRNDL